MELKGLMEWTNFDKALGYQGGNCKHKYGTPKPWKSERGAMVAASLSKKAIKAIRPWIKLGMGYPLELLGPSLVLRWRHSAFKCP